MNWAFDEENFGCGDGAYDHNPPPQPSRHEKMQAAQLRRIAAGNTTNKRTVTADLDNSEDFVESPSAKSAKDWNALDSKRG